jgi:nickel/cobalt exporter
MNWFIEAQRWLYGGMGEGLRANPDLAALPAFLAASFAFGMVHALMPGHGKSVLVSYHLGRRSRVIDGVITGALLAMTHVGIAVLFVTAGVAVISRSLAAAGRAPAFEAVSAMLIALTGAFLLYRALRPSSHSHESDGRALAVSTGLVPCPLTTFILTYAIVHHELALGFAAVAAMLGGVIVTIVCFAVAAVFLRERFLGAMQRSEGLRERVAFWLELAGAAGVLFLGLAMLQRAAAWL